jgi:hypothetical protein
VLDDVSELAIAGRAQMFPDATGTSASPWHEGDTRNAPVDDPDAPEAILWAALSLAPDDGISVPALMTATGMGRRWIYYRLRELANTGRVVQTLRGTWRIAESDGDAQ